MTLEQHLEKANEFVASGNTPLYEAQPRQAVFHSCPSKFRLYGGSAGGGKTEALLWEAVALLNEWRGCTGIIMRRKLSDLRLSFIKRWLEKIPQHLYKYNKTERVVTWLPTNSTLYFGYCDSDDDLMQYHSAEFDFIGMDETTHFTEYQIKYMWSRLRRSVSNATWDPKWFGGTNPGGPGHEFIKRLFINGEFTESEKDAGFTSDDFTFVPAKLSDNKYIDEMYKANLKMLPEHERKQLLDGDWSAYKGRFFEDFDYSVHVTPEVEIPENWPRYRSIDYGSTSPFACLWFTIDEEGNVIVYREYYRAGEVVDANTANVIARSLDEKYAMPPIIDTSVFANHGHGESIGQRMSRNGLSCVPADKDRLGGWSIVKQYLSHSPDHPPKLRIFPQCENLIRELREIMTDKRNEEDLDTKGSDHALDALRYFLKTVMSKKALPRPQEDPISKLDKEMADFFRSRQRQRLKNYA